MGDPEFVQRMRAGCLTSTFHLVFIFIYLFFIFIYLAAPGLSCGMHVGSSSLIRDRTRAPCIGSTEP